MFLLTYNDPALYIYYKYNDFIFISLFTMLNSDIITILKVYKNDFKDKDDNGSGLICMCWTMLKYSMLIIDIMRMFLLIYNIVSQVWSRRSIWHQRIWRVLVGPERVSWSSWRPSWVTAPLPRRSSPNENEWVSMSSWMT